jgi:UDP-glucose 4-epimerase
MKRKILVTGGTGYIGSHTVVELQAKGFEVVVVDNLSNSRADALDGIAAISHIKPTFHQVDLTNAVETAQLLQTHPDVLGIIHFAAYKSVVESVREPVKYYRNNLVSLMNLLDQVKRSPAIPLVFSSSCTVYGQPDVLPVNESAPLKKAESPYGQTKQICESILMDTVKAQEDLHVVALRYFNPVGAHPSGLIGELPSGVPDNLLPYITQTAAGIRPELRIFGNDYSTPDGSCIRDFIHVVDLAKAHVVAVDRLLGKKADAPFEVFNLGTGNGISVLEMVTAFEHVTGVTLNKRIVGRRPGDIEKVWADTQKANQVLGWKAELGVEAMVASAWAWEKRQRGITGQ